jgi:hypothetical protein
MCGNKEIQISWSENNEPMVVLVDSEEAATQTLRSVLDNWILPVEERLKLHPDDEKTEGRWSDLMEKLVTVLDEYEATNDKSAN